MTIADSQLEILHFVQSDKRKPIFVCFLWLQPLVSQVIPQRIDAFNKLVFFLARPAFDLLFSLNR